MTGFSVLREALKFKGFETVCIISRSNWCLFDCFAKIDVMQFSFHLESCRMVLA